MQGYIFVHVVGILLLDQVISMLLSTAPLLGGIVGFLLDNIMPGIVVQFLSFDDIISCITHTALALLYSCILKDPCLRVYCIDTPGVTESSDAGTFHGCCLSDE